MSSLTSSPDRFSGKRVLVVGAAHGGIGGAVAERMALEGAAVELASIDEPARLLKRLRRITDDVRWHYCDMADRDSLEELARRLGEGHLPLYSVINNAGIESSGELVDMVDDDITRQLDINLRGAIQLTQLTVPLVERGGSFIHVGSILGIGGARGFAAYSASKAGLTGFVQSMAIELAPNKVRINLVAPALVHTPMSHKYSAQWSRELEAQILACHPLGMGMPHDVAAAISFLASSEARWITGVVLPMGWTPHYPLPNQ